MSKAYDGDPQNKVITAENEYHGVHKSGVKLFGKPDRVEVNKSGKNIIADYKTKRKIEHVEDDIETCLQVVLYAWLCENNKDESDRIEIDKGVYRYLRYKKDVNCDYNKEIKKELDEKLNHFVDTVKNNSFTKAKNKEACKYCTYGDICNALDEREDNNG